LAKKILETPSPWKRTQLHSCHPSYSRKCNIGGWLAKKEDPIFKITRAKKGWRPWFKQSRACLTSRKLCTQILVPPKTEQTEQ
jgi:hypothetical protein